MKGHHVAIEIKDVLERCQDRIGKENLILDK